MQLYPYQIEGVKALISHKRFLLRDEPGLGKTVQLIKAAYTLFSQSASNKTVLVLSPKSMVKTWEREISKWSGRAPLMWEVINHDALISKARKNIMHAWDLVIADESHMYLKNIKTKRAKSFFDLISVAENVWLATATVASKSAEDYWCTFKILLPSAVKHLTKQSFIKRYCEQVEQQFYSARPVRGIKCVKVKDNLYKCTAYKYEGFKNTSELKTILNACSLRRTEAEVELQLPPLTETEFIIEDKKKDLIWSEAAKKDLIDRLINAEEVPSSYQEMLLKNGIKKIPSVVEILQTYPKDKKAVIFCWHRELANLLVSTIKEECPDRVPASLTGEISDVNVRQVIIDNFETGDINTLIVNMQSGGAGITLVAATVGIYVQFPHSVIHWVQSRKRIHRIGSKKPVQIIKMMTEGSIDRDIFSVLTERAAFIQEVEG